MSRALTNEILLEKLKHVRGLGSSETLTGPGDSMGSIDHMAAAIRRSILECIDQGHVSVDDETLLRSAILAVERLSGMCLDSIFEMHKMLTEIQESKT